MHMDENGLNNKGRFAIAHGLVLVDPVPGILSKPPVLYRAYYERAARQIPYSCVGTKQPFVTLLRRSRAIL